MIINCLAQIKILSDIAMVPPILMAGIKSTEYKSKRSDRTLTGAFLEMEISMANVERAN